jgi:hypothetical protein
MKDLEEEVSHECWDYYMAGLAAESALVSAQMPSLHQYRFQAGRVASVRWFARVVLSPPGSLQILLAPVLLDRSARPGISCGRRNKPEAIRRWPRRRGAFFGAGSLKWPLKASQKARSGRLKLREMLTGAPGNFPKQV